MINKMLQAKCVLQAEGTSGVSGTLQLYSGKDGKGTIITGSIAGLHMNGKPVGNTDYLNGIHVHELTDLSKGCAGAGGHFNPLGWNHGGPTDKVRHPGDFGNLLTQPQADGSTTTEVFIRAPAVDLTTVGEGILNRSIVVHAGADDLGKGGNF